MILSFFKKTKKETQAVVNSIVDVEYRAVALTDKGAVRTQNQDSVLFVKPFDNDVRNSKGCLAIVADGMGGHKSGEVAAQMATEIFSKEYFKSSENKIKALENCFDTTNEKIFCIAQKNAKYKGMGTTFSSVVLWQDELYITHIGDSRIYLINDDAVVQLTKDHTYVQYLIDTKVINESERESHPNGNVITKALGTQKKAVPDVFMATHKLKTGDKILLCSDGLYEYVKSDELKEIVTSLSQEKAAHKLIQLAKNRGGHDNISVLIITKVNSNSNTNKDTQEIY